MASGNLFMAHKTGFTVRSMQRAISESGFQESVVKKGDTFDLWVLAYPEPAPAERIEADRAACFPKEIGKRDKISGVEVRDLVS
jgi:hypothetical protein